MDSAELVISSLAREDTEARQTKLSSLFYISSLC